MSTIVTNTGPTTLTKTWYADGTATDVGTVTIGIDDANGTTVVASGTATANGADGTYTYSLATQTTVKLLTVTWTRTDTSAALVDLLEVTGSRLFTEAQARTFRAKADGTAALASSSEYTDAMIADEHDRIVAKLEAWTNRAWIPRYCRIELPGTGSRELNLNDGIPRDSTGRALNRPGRLYDVSTIITASASGTSITASNIVIDGATLRLTTGTFTRATTSNPFNVTVEYEYGLPYPADSVDDIAMLLLVKKLVPSAIPDSALSWSADFGSMQVVQPGGPMSNVSSIAEVNAWVVQHHMRLPI